MLERLFVSVLNMSLIGSYAIVFVLIARLLLKKTPKIFSYALWGIVLFRLLCPFSFESGVSLIPTGKVSIPQDIIYNSTPQISTGIAVLDSMVNPLLPAPSNIGNSVNPIQIWLFIGAAIWSLGLLAMLIYSIIAFVKLKRNLIGAAHLKENIYLADHISTPFVMGLLKPKIYLPSSLSDGEKDFIIAHELCHLKRFDHATRILGFAALVVHWFNPLAWIAFIASGKDMELSADESVMQKMDRDIRAEYSQSLLRFGTVKRMIHATPLAFGEGDTKNRVKNVLNYQKPALGVVVIAIVAVVAIGIGLMSNQKNNSVDNNVEVTIGESVKFSKEEIEKAIEVVINDFFINAEHVELHSLSYNEEYSDSQLEQFIDNYGEDIGPNNIIIISSDFYVDSKAGGAWNPNSDYNWMFILSRNDKNSEWVLDSYGY